LYGQCRAGAQIIFPESGRGLGHVTPTILAVRSAILVTAWLLVYFCFSLVLVLSNFIQFFFEFSFLQYFSLVYKLHDCNVEQLHDLVTFLACYT